MLKIVSQLIVAISLSCLANLAHALQFANTGSGTLHVTNVTLALAGPFVVNPTQTCTGATVNPGGTCSIPVTFTPTAAGTYSNNVIVATAEGKTYSLPLSATATDPCGQSITIGANTYGTKYNLDGKCWTTSYMKHAAGAGTQSVISTSNVTAYDWTAASAPGLCGALGYGWALPTMTQWKALVTAGGTGWTGNKLGGIFPTLTGWNTGTVDQNQTSFAYAWSSTLSSGTSYIYTRLAFNSTTVSTAVATPQTYRMPVLCITNAVSECRNK